ncbi:MAG TPA: hypothetical protein VGZ29_05585 [Terriglobia bacterium]|nr:hypothetical protein [Terriglobia bacterium]
MPKATRTLVLSTRGAQVEIAGIAECSRGYVWSVMHGRKQPSQKLWDAVVTWMDRHTRTSLSAMAAAEMEAHDGVAS